VLCIGVGQEGEQDEKGIDNNDGSYVEAESVHKGQRYLTCSGISEGTVVKQEEDGPQQRIQQKYYAETAQQQLKGTVEHQSDLKHEYGKLARALAGIPSRLHPEASL
jgi:hypothetical protein